MSAGRERFTNPRKYPWHWAFWSVVVLVVLGLLVVMPTVGIVAALLVVGIGVARWLGFID